MTTYELIRYTTTFECIQTSVVTMSFFSRSVGVARCFHEKVW